MNEGELQKYYEKHGRSLLLDYIEKEEKKKERVVLINDHWIGKRKKRDQRSIPLQFSCRSILGCMAIRDDGYTEKSSEETIGTHEGHSTTVLS